MLAFGATLSSGSRNHHGADMTEQPKDTSQKHGVLGHIERVYKRKISSTSELPPPNTRRWVARRKAAVAAAVSNGMITIEEACRRYQMSEEEFLAWQRAFENYGILGLRAGCVQQYRSARPSQPADPSPGQVSSAGNENTSAKT
jgi:transposase-like protein